jgi:hypothetical protein
MKYKPTHFIKPSGSAAGKLIVMVAAFEDLRNVPDRLMIGEVADAHGNKIPVFPKYVKAGDVIASGIAEYLKQSGFAVSDKRPAWDLKTGSVGDDWGDILIGGSIDDLWVKCREGIAEKKYSAGIRLNAVIVDVRNKRILYKTLTESESSRDDVIFSESRLEAQINGVVSDAIDKIFDGGEAQRRMIGAASRPDSPAGNPR